MTRTFPPQPSVRQAGDSLLLCCKFHERLCSCRAADKLQPTNKQTKKGPDYTCEGQDTEHWWSSRGRLPTQLLEVPSRSVPACLIIVFTTLVEHSVLTQSTGGRNRSFSLTFLYFLELFSNFFYLFFSEDTIDCFLGAASHPHQALWVPGEYYFFL